MPLFEKSIAVWDWDEDTAVDRTANDTHTVNNVDIAETNGGVGSTHVAGKLGNARRLSRGGSTDHHYPRADTGPGDIFRFANYASGFAYATWANQNIDFATTKKTLMGKRTSGATECVLQIDTATSLVEAVVANTTPTSFTAQSTTTIPTGSGALKHCVLNWDAVTKVVEVWVNGVMEGTATLTGSPNATTAPFTLSGEPGIGLYHDGDLDQSIVFNDKLTPTEIANLYNGGLGLAYPFVEAPIPLASGLFLKPRLGYAYGPPEADRSRGPIFSDIVAVSDTTTLDMDELKPRCFCGAQFFNDASGTSTASPSAGTVTLTIKTVNTDPKFEEFSNNVITAATPTTLEWCRGTLQVMGTPASIADATHYRLVGMCYVS